MNRDMVDHPRHYNRYTVEVIDIIEDLPFPLGSAIKYIMRAPWKLDETEDLEKAAWYLCRMKAQGKKLHLPARAASGLLQVRAEMRDPAYQKMVGELVRGKLNHAIGAIRSRLEELEDDIKVA